MVEQEQKIRGKLKIFFGAAPGVGKTYSMLESARTKLDAGVDVVVGVVETHGRSETAARLIGFERLPGDGTFDLDAALARHPDLILMDELAHSNSKSARHPKRWQDVEELLDAGIDVYSTLNVQHIESLNDVVAQITGVVVRETIPDKVLELADEIELIDLPVEELLSRLKEGKVYVPEQAARALENFFKPGNLNALREMALRHTADRVDFDVNAIRGRHGNAKTWPVTERILLAIGPTPYAQNLVRATKRMAIRWEAEWFVVFVEPSDSSGISEAARQNLRAALHLAESLGAEAVTLQGDSVADAVLHFARVQNVTRIVVGKSPGSKLVGALIANSGEITVIAMDGGVKVEQKFTTRVEVPPWQELGQAALWICAATAFGMFFREYIALANLVMVYLLAVVAVAMRYSKTTAMFASVLSVASFDFFCVPPYMTFGVSDAEYLLTFGVMLMVSMVISGLTVKLRQQAQLAIEREHRTQNLYRLSKSLARTQRIFEAAEALLLMVHAAFRVRGNVFLPDTEEKISFRRRVAEGFVPNSQEEGIAQWCFDRGQLAGKGTDSLPGALTHYRPLRLREKSYGVLALEEPPEDSGQAALLEALLNQTVQAMERITALDEARQSALAAESERLRNSLLSSVSHDLRTPLTSISAAAATLLDPALHISGERRSELLNAIEDESQRLNRLVTNLLEMTRLEDGRVVLHKVPCSMEEVVGSVLDSMERLLKGREIRTTVARDLPEVAADPQLLAQALQNLLENALKYSPPDAPIEINAEKLGDTVRVRVLDEGPGVAAGTEERVFEKFYRGDESPSARGVGLGLTIVKSIVEAHGGTVRVQNRAKRGACFEIVLPAIKP